MPKSFCYDLIRGRTEIGGFILFFCGRMIPVFMIRKEGCNEISFKFSIDEEIEGIIKSSFFGKEIKDLFEVQNVEWINRNHTGMTLPRKDILEMHRILKTPVFVDSRCFNNGWSGVYKPCINRYRGDTHIITNICLDDIGFRDYMDAWQAFQELDRFVSNELSPMDNKVVIIPDKLKAESHGFDKFSFRKDKRT